MAISITKYISIIIGTRVITAVKNCNCQKHHNGYIAAKFIRITSFIRATGPTIVQKPSQIPGY